MIVSLLEPLASSTDIFQQANVLLAKEANM